ncbi:ABC transporter permease [Arhodomonas sp. AD133]|uniref:ABC transporter permease n=1 Tax=Arhodomonas sp. AD133 TaxID=3415009 RepID=UPI003EBE5D7A
MAYQENVNTTGVVRRRPGGAPAGGWRQKAILLLQWREASIMLAGIALVIYFQWTSPYFLSADNLGVLAQFAAATAIIAAGEVMVLVNRELDLSVGQVYALSPLVMYFAQQAGAPLPLAIVLALAAAAFVGLINGAITVGLRVPSFVTTLGMLFFVNGFNLTISGGFPVQPEASAFWATLFGGNIVVQITWAIVLAIVFQFVLTKTRWGLHTIATGGNPLGAAEVGIRTGRVKIGNFMICSLLGGFAGILDAFRIESVDPLAGGTEIMFMAIASAVIGGTLLTGGSGTVIGAFLGAVVLGILKDGFTISGVNAYTFDMILGLAIVVTMMMNVHLSRIRAGGKS